MLNISNNPIKNFDFKPYKSGQIIFSITYFNQFNRFLIALFLILIVVLFLPWTQNIFGKGYVTTLQPEKRPQTIQSPIPGKIEAWMVREGDLVHKGDTLLKISEIKSEYFDPELLLRTVQQLEAKQKSSKAYAEKVLALESQINALRLEMDFKLSQAINKQKQSILYIENDSLKLVAARTDLEIAQIRLNRVLSLNEQGLKATREVEEKQLNLRKAESAYVSASNSVINAKNEVLITTSEIKRLKASYQEKLAKVKSDKATASSLQFEAEGAVAKLKNTLANYKQRQT